MSQKVKAAVAAATLAVAGVLLYFTLYSKTPMPGKSDPYEVACPSCSHRESMTKEAVVKRANPHPEGGWAMPCPKCGVTAFIARAGEKNLAEIVAGSQPPR